MRILGTQGYEGQDAFSDGVTSLTGTGFSYSSSVPPASKSSRSAFFRQTRTLCQWNDGGHTGADIRQPSGTDWGFGGWVGWTGYDPTTLKVGVATPGGTSLISVRPTTPDGRVALYVNDLFVADAPGVFWGDTVLRKFHVEVDNTIGGSVKVYVDGDTTAPVIDYTLPAAVLTPGGFSVEASGLLFIWVDDLVAWEYGVGVLPDVLDNITGGSCEWVSLNSNGTQTDWEDGSGGVGTYDLIDEVPYSDADFIEATAIGDRSSFGHTGITDDRILFFRTLMRVRRTGVATGTRISVEMTDALGNKEYPTGTAPGAPSDGFVTIMVDADTIGGILDKTVFNASEIGPVAVA